jgi:hypothetical protein
MALIDRKNNGNGDEVSLYGDADGNYLVTSKGKGDPYAFPLCEANCYNDARDFFKLLLA